MRELIPLLLVAALACGCATVDEPPRVTRQDIVELAQAGADAAWIIDRLKETGTVIALSAGDIVSMHKAGVPPEVLDWMQAEYLEEVRRRQAMFDQMYYGGPFGRCAWPPRYEYHPRFGWRVRPWPGC